jgi:hypothetical protein
MLLQTLVPRLSLQEGAQLALPVRRRDWDSIASPPGRRN